MSGIYNFSISDIKKHLGNGLGLRSNKYAVVVPLPKEGSKKLAILSRSTSLPERQIGTVDLYHKGRRYKVRGETDLSNQFTINVIDDSKMTLRKYFDAWMKSVDDTEPDYESLLSQLAGSEWTDLLNAAGGTIQALTEVGLEIKQKGLLNYSLSEIKDTLSGNSILAAYQVDVDIYQLDGEGNPVYGYRLQNCYPTEVGAVEINDEEQNNMSQFSVILTYSDFIPLDPNASVTSQVVSTVAGDAGTGLLSSWKTFKETFNL